MGQQIIHAVSEREAILAVFRQTELLEGKVRQLESANAILRRQLKAVMLRNAVLEGGDGD